MRKQKTGTLYEFCANCSQCPVAVESEVSGQTGLALRDDFGGEIKLTDGQLKDFAAFLAKRFS